MKERVNRMRSKEEWRKIALNVIENGKSFKSTVLVDNDYESGPYNLHYTGFRLDGLIVIKYPRGIITLESQATDDFSGMPKVYRTLHGQFADDYEIRNKMDDYASWKSEQEWLARVPITTLMERITFRSSIRPEKDNEELAYVTNELIKRGVNVK
jgi:hypothetical protein